jgi:hypothetical protein
MFSFLISNIENVLNLFYFATHLTPNFFCNTLKSPKTFLRHTSTVFYRSIWGEMHNKSFFYNLAAQLEGTRGTLLCPSTVVENHFFNLIIIIIVILLCYNNYYIMIILKHAWHSRYVLVLFSCSTKFSLLDMS